MTWCKEGGWVPGVVVKITLARSRMLSEMMFYLKGHGVPLKVR